MTRTNSSGSRGNSGGSGLSRAISNGNLSLKEALKIAGNNPNKLGQIAYKANQQGSTIGRNLVNHLGSGAGGANLNFMAGLSGNSGYNTFIKGLQGLNLNKGQVYGGASMTAGKSGSTVNGGYWSTPATYNPIVVNKNRGMTISGAQQSEGGGAGKGGRNKGGSGGSMSSGGNGEWRGGYKNQTKEEILADYAAESGQSTDTAATDDTATDTTTDPSITINGPGNMSGGGSAGGGATGFRRASGRNRRLGIRGAGTNQLNRSNQFFNALN